MYNFKIIIVLVAFYLLIIVCTWSILYQFGGESVLHAIEKHWRVSLTMAFGSFIAGATSEGGGAIAFPVFTKVLNINPSDAKIFSLAIQSVGMTAASVFIIIMRIQIEWWVIFWASLAGAMGMIFGLAWLPSVFSPAAAKLSFTALVSSFAITLFFINRHTRSVNNQVPLRGKRELGLVLLAGFVGGSISSLVGNGIDIITFSLLVLLFRISEKIATPTSVVLMAINSLVGITLHALVLNDVHTSVQEWWLAAVPVVVIGAPLGAFVCTYLNRIVVARFLIFLIAIEFSTSLWLIPIDVETAFVGGAVLTGFSCIYIIMLRTSIYEPDKTFQYHIKNLV